MSLKSLNTRLTFIFSITSICFAGALFALTYQLIGSSLTNEDNARFGQLALRFWALYETYGDELLTESVFKSEYLDDNQTLVRISSTTGNTILFYFPEHFNVFDLSSLERLTRSGIIQNPDIRSNSDTAIRTLLHDRIGSRYLEAMTIILPDGRILQLGIEVTNRFTVLKRFRLLFAALAIPFLLLSITGGLLFSRNSLRPIRSLIRTTKSIIATGKLDERISERGTGDELEELVDLFNKMMEKIESLVNGMRNALDNVAHDLRTPITRLRGRAEAALQRLEGDDQDPAVRGLRECLDEALRIQSMLSLLMDISEAETGYMKLSQKPVDLSSVLEDMAELYKYAAEDKEIVIKTDISPDLTVQADENRIRQVISNLLDNAVKYTPGSGSITISAGVCPGEIGEDHPHTELKQSRGGTRENRVFIRISDTGIGIAGQEQPLIWNRLYRCDTSRAETGLGLGLSLVKAVVEAHGGTVSVESNPGRGSEFTVIVPSGVNH